MRGSFFLLPFTFFDKHFPARGIVGNPRLSGHTAVFVAICATPLSRICENGQRRSPPASPVGRRMWIDVETSQRVQVQPELH